MEKYGIVLSDELFKQYMGFVNNGEYDRQTVEKILHFYKIRIILTSGFDHLSNDSQDFTYIVRVVKENHFVK